MNARVKELVRTRARLRCEYCHFPQRLHPQRFPIDHVVPRSHGGTDDPANLALCCPSCNWHKGPNLSGLDPQSNRICALFDPRAQVWTEHFEWRGSELVGRTDVGRATIVVMHINDAARVELRTAAGAGAVEN
jgi:hypothetical protein